MCIGIAVIGTLTSLLIRRTPIARPGLPFTPGSLFISAETWRMFRADRPLFRVLLISSLFWFLGGVIQPSVNAFGTLQIHYGAARTSAMVVCMAVGIMFGCLWAGSASRGRIRFGFVTLGAWGIVGCLSALALIGAREGTVVGSDPGGGRFDGGQPAGGRRGKRLSRSHVDGAGARVVRRRVHAQ